MRIALGQCGQEYELRVLRDGAEALRFVLEQRMSALDPPIPCVIVLDLHIPGHSGLEVLRAIKQAPPLSHVHVVVFTSAASPKKQDEAHGLGVRLYLDKPSDLDEFIVAARCILDICNEGIKAQAAVG